ncbi:MAG: glycosyltransferase [Pirellulales bacterium]
MSLHQISSLEDLRAVPSLVGGIAVGFCNVHFIHAAPLLKDLGCKTIWVNCMCWVGPEEVAYARKHGPFSAYVFQSDYQRSQLKERYRSFGASEAQFHQIRGAFCSDEFPFSPLAHRSNEEFVIGRIARPDLDKWSSNLWPIYSAINYEPKRARVMAWCDRLTQKCGTPPDWVETLSTNEETAQEFLRSLHCMFPINGGAKENWPRSGLEAMAVGVPIVAQNEWGWSEMVVHGETGFLGGSDEELAEYTATLARDEDLRMRVVHAARKRLVDELANPDVLWRQWQRLFDSLTGTGSATECSQELQESS